VLGGLALKGFFWWSSPRGGGQEIICGLENGMWVMRRADP
jgi:hypothetical protein